MLLALALLVSGKSEALPVNQTVLSYHTHVLLTIYANACLPQQVKGQSLLISASLYHRSPSFHFLTSNIGCHTLSIGEEAHGGLYILQKINYKVYRKFSIGLCPAANRYMHAYVLHINYLFHTPVFKQNKWIKTHHVFGILHILLEHASCVIQYMTRPHKDSI